MHFNMWHVPTTKKMMVEEQKNEMQKKNIINMCKFLCHTVFGYTQLPE